MWLFACVTVRETHFSHNYWTDSEKASFCVSKAVLDTGRRNQGNNATSKKNEDEYKLKIPRLS